MICLICLHRIVFCCIKLRRCVEMIRDDTTDTDKKKKEIQKNFVKIQTKKTFIVFFKFSCSKKQKKSNVLLFNKTYDKLTFVNFQTDI